MVGNVLVLGLRVFYAAIALVGLSLAASGYPPSGSGLPVVLLVGGGLAVVGVAGVIWPQKIRSGTSTTRAD